MSKTVFLFIDVQKTLLQDPEKGGIVGRTTYEPIWQSLLDSARKSANKPKVIHVRDNFSDDGPGFKGSDLWQLAYQPQEGEPIVDKEYNDAFKDTNLAEYINEQDKIVVAGLCSNYCVRASVLGSLKHGNKDVYLVKGAHGTNDHWEDASKKAHILVQEVEDEVTKQGVQLITPEEIIGRDWLL